MTEIPNIDIAPLYGEASRARDAVDAEILRAATKIGFMRVAGLPDDALSPKRRASLMRVFSLSDDAKRRLTRQKFAPENPNVYRGWFPTQPGMPSYKEGVDIGADLVRPEAVDASDPLTEPTPLPDEAALPGWRADVIDYYRAMEAAGFAILRAIARGLALDEAAFAAPFAAGNSTLRLICYPSRPEDELAGNRAALLPDGRHILGAEHVDSGFITLLAQDGVAGLEAQAASGDWIPVPPEPGGLAVNFGKLLSAWTGGRVRATPHRVAGSGALRRSLPFFFEPRVDARFEPIAALGGAAFEPFLYGDWVWAQTTRFTEFRGMEGLRPPRGPALAQPPGRL